VFFVAIDKFYNLNAHLRGKIELAKISERSEQNRQLYFVLIEVLVSCILFLVLRIVDFICGE